MRNWKNWLFPILTALTAAALALLPLRLATLEDQELTGTVRTEPLTADNNFPAKPPELPGRIWLLVQWQEIPDNLAIMSQEPEGDDRDQEIRRLREALKGLGDLLPPETAAELLAVDGESWSWERYYLRDQTDLSSAGFTLVSTYDKRAGRFLSATLDGEGGQLVQLQFIGAKPLYFTLSPRETGEALLNRLDLSFELADAVEEGEREGWATFRLPECKSWFSIFQTGGGLSFGFSLDWETVDEEIAASYGHEPTDADSIQTW